MPCAGCEKNVEKTKVKLRFVGRTADGKLVKGAPGNYEVGEITLGPLIWAQVHPKIWELVEPPPELRVPDVAEKDSVYDEGVFVPDDQTQESPSNAEVTLSGAVKPELDEHEKEVIAGYKSQGMYLLDADEGILVPPDESIEKDSRSRDELKALLDAAGIKYSKHSRTETLAEMVQTLESKENN